MTSCHNYDFLVLISAFDVHVLVQHDMNISSVDSEARVRDIYWYQHVIMQFFAVSIYLISQDVILPLKQTNKQTNKKRYYMNL